MTPLEQFEVAENSLCIDTGLFRAGHTACYLVESAGELAFIDCGCHHTTERLLALLEEQALAPEQVRYVMPTHVHLDHAGGAGSLMAACPNATLVTHAMGMPHMIDPSRLQAGATAVYGEETFLNIFGALTPVDEARTQVASDGQTFELGSRRLRFADTPGHANHHGCFFDEHTRLWYTGDAFGLSYREFDHAGQPWVFATTTPVAFDPEAWLHSLDKLLAAKPLGMCLTHYGRINEVAALTERLRENILAHKALALAEERHHADDEQRAGRLKQAVEDLLMREAARHCPDKASAEVRRLLALDIDLNAQGLHVWLKRRAKAACGHDHR